VARKLRAYCPTYVLFRSDTRHVRKTMVIQDRSGKWNVYPVPNVSPLLSKGTYEESASVQSFSDDYGVEKGIWGNCPVFIAFTTTGLRSTVSSKYLSAATFWAVGLPAV